MEYTLLDTSHKALSRICSGVRRTCRVIEDLSIASVERLLTKLGYDLADLVDVPAPGAGNSGSRADKTA